jgi:large subunit ribosomal protein L29
VKISDLRERSNADLEQLQQELARELWKARFTNYTNQLDDTAKIARTRKTIAQIKTLLTERARGIVRVVTPKDETVIAAERAAKAKAKAKAAEAEVEETETAEAAPEEAAPKKRATKKKAAEPAEKAEKPKKRAPARKKKGEE